MKMTPPDSPVRLLAEALRSHPAITSKCAIAAAGAALELRADGPGRPGDDAAVLPAAQGYDLLAGEGFIPAFIADDPWFAGWCAVMVNLSDIAAMGGRPQALLDQIWAPDAASAAPVLAGMKAAARAYDVPLVGGHTNFAAPGLGLAATMLGHARALISSFDARPGDLLIAAMDHRGAYRNFDNFFAAGNAPQERLRGDLALLPDLAEAGLVTAGKDISQGGIAGTALMLAESSSVGMTLDLNAIVPPAGVPLSRWLHSFPSFGFLLSVAPSRVNAVCARFAARGIEAAAIGQVTPGSAVILQDGRDRATFWDHGRTPYLNLGGQDA